MQYDIEAGGRLRRVAISRLGDALAVSVDGHLYQVDAVRVDAHTLSLVVDRGVSPGPQAGAPDAPEGGVGSVSVYDTTFAAEAGSGRLVVGIGTVAVAVGVDGRSRAGKPDAGGAPGAGPQRIAAPMPGKVVRVLVAPGEPVRARQPVVVVEAMKMENELRADREGTVAEVHAREGMPVESGALLVVIHAK